MTITDKFIEKASFGIGVLLLSTFALGTMCLYEDARAKKEFVYLIPCRDDMAVYGKNNNNCEYDLRSIKTFMEAYKK